MRFQLFTIGQGGDISIWIGGVTPYNRHHMPGPAPIPQNPTLVRGLGPVAAIALIVAGVMGTGVFLKARVMTCNVDQPWLVMAENAARAAGARLGKELLQGLLEGRGGGHVGQWHVDGEGQRRLGLRARRLVHA